ncbi:MAG: 3-deoxy-7-phosphoheptulonate synthase [Chloracidobacterium sp.]|uniref:Phospho-2-dehydro-3-deoxyheptonate aldolase n=1 Tax=Chloracidobacterium validum TaxID=2821543 RepID=A0ABX8BD25_9BACT|nr:3-deoxy-7-phosphoheptulonate synthase [Chloracidobacterium validum]QUW03553.1 3-deoxy-7-phosphoheptulonate synthase [Chloracidobacterium validum]
MRHLLDDVRIQSFEAIPTPDELREAFPISDQAAQTVYFTREAIKRILHHDDDRLLVVVGPCSIHDPAAALEYASRLRPLCQEYADYLVVTMRVYFEKPRTTVGWKGLVNDPGLDGTFNVRQGLRLARQLLVQLAEMGVPAGSEFVDLISPQYTAELVSWGAIGARTTESQSHRELASGLSCPVGFKNGTGGTIQIAVDAVRSAREPHAFLSHTKDGRSALFRTTGNPDCHIILRGGRTPNYDAHHVAEAVQLMESAGLPARIMIDCSHANAAKDHRRQAVVCRSVMAQVAEGNRAIIGTMLESHLVEGKQAHVPGQPLVYGQSITDACIGWEETEILLADLAQAVRARRHALAQG